jgi:hypothetical protein
MYAFIIVVCLIAAQDQCISFVEDPPLYYETREGCEKNMVDKTVSLRELVSKNKETELIGQCVYFPNIKST